MATRVRVFYVEPDGSPTPEKKRLGWADEFTVPEEGDAARESARRQTTERTGWRTMSIVNAVDGGLIVSVRQPR